METNEMDVVRADALLLAINASVLHEQDKQGWEQLEHDCRMTAICHQEYVSERQLFELVKFHLEDPRWDFKQRGSISEYDWSEFDD